ncbi:MAG: ABC transporter ATP-binding protein, partial [Nitrososphaerales archaeon]|nr:ABC transporter ATP-binding protein [Nitrososphaerales archaeon]
MKQYEVARNFGYVPQNGYIGFDRPRVFDVVLMGRRPYITWQYQESDIEKVWDILSKLGIIHLAMRRFDELSGGQQQKVLIARALAQEAKVLLLDEPTSNLDIRHQLEVMNLIKNLIVTNGISAIAAIHDLNLASMYCDKILMMKEGKIFAAGTPSSVLTPKNIREVFGVDVAVHNNDGKIRIFVLNIVSS